MICPAQSVNEQSSRYLLSLLNENLKASLIYLIRSFKIYRNCRSKWIRSIRTILESNSVVLKNMSKKRECLSCWIKPKKMLFNHSTPFRQILLIREIQWSCSDRSNTIRNITIFWRLFCWSIASSLSYFVCIWS